MRDFRLVDAFSAPPGDEWEESRWPEHDLREWADDPFYAYALRERCDDALDVPPSRLGGDALLRIVLARIERGMLRLYRRCPKSAPAAAAPAAIRPTEEVPWDYEPPVEAPRREPEETQEADWIEIEIVLEDGTPVRNEPVTLTLSDGSTRSTTTDENGVARLLQIVSGECELSFARDRRELRAG